MNTAVQLFVHKINTILGETVCVMSPFKDNKRNKVTKFRKIIYQSKNRWVNIGQNTCWVNSCLTQSLGSIHILPCAGLYLSQHFRVYRHLNYTFYKKWLTLLNEQRLSVYE